ncbi:MULTISPECIES: hypothetical protein [Microbacterium]|uniref:hypothetical protein n=1 Tax=Microbacterium TaxID=33882 RepID=UPI00249DAB82|nr:MULTISPECIES: hypothetical protein [Microbacterium]WHE37212.1 hypothetical protein P6897_05715 [Microbacterium sp. BDGP8]WRK18390.1 hypothetical protein VC184_05085 [Microbacterium plantarum]
MSAWKRIRPWIAPAAVGVLFVASVVGFLLRDSNELGAPERTFAVLSVSRSVLAVAGAVVAVLLVIFVAKPTFVPVVGVLLFAIAMLLCVVIGAFLRGEAWGWLPYSAAALCGLAALAHLEGAFDRKQLGRERHT